MVGNNNSNATNIFIVENNNVGGDDGTNSSQQQPTTSSSSSSHPTSPSHGAANAAVDRIHWRILNQAAAAICHSTGFGTIQSSALKALTAMGHKYLNDISRSSCQHCDHTGRSIVTPGDVFMAMVNSETNLQDFPEFLQSLRHSRLPTFTLKCQSPVKSPPVLRISEPRPHPSHFPNFLPSFPDPHTYIRTEVKDDIDSNYEKVRRLNAQNRRDVENSLVSYALSMHPSSCVFQDLARRIQFEAKDVIERGERERLQGGGGGDNLVVKLESGEANGEMGSTSELENGNGGEQEEEAEGRRRRGSSARKNLANNGGGVGDGDNNTTDGTTTATIIRSSTNKDSQSNGIQDLLIFEEQFRLKETERSYVLKRIPPFCHVLFPFDQSKPHISALATDDMDMGEDEHNYFAQILSKEMEDELADNDDEEPMEIGGG